MFRFSTRAIVIQQYKVLYKGWSVIYNLEDLTMYGSCNGYKYSGSYFNWWMVRTWANFVADPKHIVKNYIPKENRNG